MDIITEYFKKQFISPHFIPPHPEQAVIKNWLYPQGLTEQDIWNYYQKNKKNLLGWIGDRTVAFFLKVNDILIVKRNIGDKSIKLTQENFDELITGRTLQILVERQDLSDYFVVDIDAGESHSRKEIIMASKVVVETLRPLHVEKWELLFTSPKGIHVIGYLSKKDTLDNIRSLVEELLLNQNDYLVNVKGRRHVEINLDLTPNYKRSIHICRYSLTKEGLICDDILTSKRSGKKIK